MRAWHGDDSGSMLVETCLGIVAILLVALPTAGVINYVGHATRDSAAAQQLARAIARTGNATAPVGFVVTCGAQANAAVGPCPIQVPRRMYIRISKDTASEIGFGLVLHTNASAVARAE